MPSRFIPGRPHKSPPHMYGMCTAEWGGAARSETRAAPWPGPPLTGAHPMAHDPISARTAQVRLIDGTTVTVREPSWCLGEHDQDGHLSDLGHEGPVTELHVETSRGSVRLLDVLFIQDPHSS